MIDSLLLKFSDSSLLYKDVSEYKTTIKEIESFALEYLLKNNQFFRENQDYSDKSLINSNRDIWNTDKFRYFYNYTSGTTRERFKYRIINKVYDKIERDCHYLHILEEFEKYPEEIVYFVQDGLALEHPIIQKIYTDNLFMTHGYGRERPVYVIKRNRKYLEDYWGYWRDLLSIFANMRIEVMIIDGNGIAEILQAMKHFGSFSFVSSLVSCTANKTNIQYLDQLKSEKCIDNYCDHMRCWDGGVTFFTCKFGVRHVLEHLSYPIVKDGKLISKDYFALENPFWNYWNGDYAEINQEYKRCDCGRLYRSFEIKRCREIWLEGANSQELNDIFRNIVGVIRINQLSNYLRVFCDQDINVETKKSVQQQLPNFILDFITL